MAYSLADNTNFQGLFDKMQIETEAVETDGVWSWAYLQNRDRT
jgi:hypothetical protein